MTDAFRAADRDRDVRAVVLTGAGRAFCAGADMDFFAGQIRGGGGTAPGGGDGPGTRRGVPGADAQLSKPTIAAINGYALGVGCTMTLLCDVRLAAAEAKLGFLFSRMGVMAELGSTYLLPRLVGIGRACELMFTGKQYPAAELERIGSGEPRGAGRGAPRRGARAGARDGGRAHRSRWRSPATRSTRVCPRTFDAQVRYEGFALEYLYRSRDHAEAVAAFKEKRPPRFEGR